MLEYLISFTLTFLFIFSINQEQISMKWIFMLKHMCILNISNFIFLHFRKTKYQKMACYMDPMLNILTAALVLAGLESYII